MSSSLPASETGYPPEPEEESEEQSTRDSSACEGVDDIVAPDKGFPRAEEWWQVARSLASELCPVLPAPLPPRPVRESRNPSSRIRHRHRRAVGTWRSSCRLVGILNSLVKGRCSSAAEVKNITGAVPLRTPLPEAYRSLYERVAKESARLERWRGGPVPTGVQAAATLVKTCAEDLYGMKPLKKSPHVELEAALVDEPSSGTVVPMLEALPHDEAAYYSDPKHLVRPESQSEALFQEITEQFTFVGGTQTQYLAYFHRAHQPGTWGWATSQQVEATCGFSVVGKKPKDGVVHAAQTCDVLPRQLLLAGCSTAV